MPADWNLFAGFLGLLVAFLLYSARATHRWLFGDPGPAAVGTPSPGPEAGAAAERPPESLLRDVALSQVLVGAAVLAAVRLTAVPPAALGLGSGLAGALPIGLGIGIGLFLLSEGAARAAERLGVGHDERLRALLAPSDRRGWVLLLGVVLPLVAAVEELVFRGAIIGALSAGFGVSPWLLAVPSSVLFGLGHGAQGRGGVVVTAALGLLLAAAFVLTGSLVAVVVAHYLVNALEFVVHEGPVGGIDRARSGELAGRRR